MNNSGLPTLDLNNIREETIRKNLTWKRLSTENLHTKFVNPSTGNVVNLSLKRAVSATTVFWVLQERVGAGATRKFDTRERPELMDSMNRLFATVQKMAINREQRDYGINYVTRKTEGIDF